MLDRREKTVLLRRGILGKIIVVSHVAADLERVAGALRGYDLEIIDPGAFRSHYLANASGVLVIWRSLLGADHRQEKEGISAIAECCKALGLPVSVFLTHNTRKVRQHCGRSGWAVYASQGDKSFARGWHEAPAKLIRRIAVERKG